MFPAGPSKQDWCCWLELVSWPVSLQGESSWWMLWGSSYLGSCFQINPWEASRVCRGTDSFLDLKEHSSQIKMSRSKLSGNRCHVTGRNRRDRNLLFGLVKGNNFTFIFLQVMLPELAACRRGTLGSHTFLWKLWLWEWSALWHCPCNGNKIWVKRGFNSTQL